MIGSSFGIRVKEFRGSLLSLPSRSPESAVTPMRVFWVLFAASAIPRIYLAHALALNPDEIWQISSSLTGDFYNVFHPPLPFGLFYLSSLVSLSELSLRATSVLAGSLWAPFIYLWLRRHFPSGAAFLAATLLAVSPNMCLLSIQMRGYSLAILAAALALYSFDGVFSCWKSAALHAGALCLGLLSEVCFAFVALALGIGGLAEIARRRTDVAAKIRWAAVQAMGLIVSAYLVVFYVSPLWQSAQNKSFDFSYIADGYPEPGDSTAFFVFISLAKQMQYLATSQPVGLLLFAMLCAGTIILLHSRRYFLLLPFVAAAVSAAAAALAHLFPLGVSRHHSPLLVLFLLPIAAFFAAIRMRYAAPLVAVAAVLAILFPFRDFFNPPLHSWWKSWLLPSLEELHRALPADAVVLADEESRLLLRYYWSGPRTPPPVIPASGPSIFRRREIHVAEFNWERTGNKVRARDEKIRSLLADARPVYLLDMGFSTMDLSRKGIPWRMEVIRHVPGALFLARLDKEQQCLDGPCKLTGAVVGARDSGSYGGHHY